MPLSASCRAAPHLNSTICLLRRSYSPRLAPPLDVAQRTSAQLNDLFVATLHSSPRRSSALCSALCRNTPHRNSTQRFVCYDAPPCSSAIRSAPHGPSLHRVAALRVAALRSASPCRATQGISTRRFVCYFAARLCSPRLDATRHFAPLHASTICLLLRSATLRHASLRNSGQRTPTLRNATQRFVYYVAPLHTALHCAASLLYPTQRNDLFVITLRNATKRSPMQLVWPRRAAAHCISTQLNDLFVTTTTRLVATRRLSTCRIFMQRPAIQRNELKL